MRNRAYEEELIKQIEKFADGEIEQVKIIFASNGSVKSYKQLAIEYLKNNELDLGVEVKTGYKCLYIRKAY